MPFLDVSDVLSDPDFATTFDVLRSTITTVKGRGVSTTQTFAGVIGVVTPAGSNDLKRMPEAARMSGAITIHTTFRLTSSGLQPDGTTADADIVSWQGRQWSVLSVDDWTQFGAGFVRAAATMLSLN